MLHRFVAAFHLWKVSLYSSIISLYSLRSRRYSALQPPTGVGVESVVEVVELAGPDVAAVVDEGGVGEVPVVDVVGRVEDIPEVDDGGVAGLSAHAGIRFR